MEEGRNELRMFAEKGSTTAATMETQRGAKAPLVSSLSQAADRSHPVREKPVFPPRLSADHFGPLSPQILSRPSLSSSAFHLWDTYYSRHRDLTSTQTSSLSLCPRMWLNTVTKPQEQMIHHILRVTFYILLWVSDIIIREWMKGKVTNNHFAVFLSNSYWIKCFVTKLLQSTHCSDDLSLLMLTAVPHYDGQNWIFTALGCLLWISTENMHIWLKVYCPRVSVAHTLLDDAWRVMQKLQRVFNWELWQC